MVNVTCPIPDSPGLDAGPHRRTVPFAQLHFKIAGGHVGLHDAPKGIPVFRIQVMLFSDILELCNEITDRPIPHNPGQGRIGRNETAIRRCLENTFHCIVEKPAVFFFTFF